MSTRRARIKAVTSLPPRRKNADTADKNKQEVEKTIKSPRTPRSSNKNNENLQKTSPGPKPLPPLLPLQAVSPKLVNTSSPQNKTTKASTPTVLKIIKFPDKVPVITTTSAFKANVFASPQAVKSSPDRKHIASLIIPSPKRNIHRPTVSQLEKLDKDVCDSGSEDFQRENRSESDNVASGLGENKSDVPDDYSVPSVPESVTDEAVMDGIVPLQPTRSAPKPIDLLKNEIISEDAKVLFDPIVPLPSPSKVRPKLRPVPRLGPHRRNSIQGSASESEDETRRALLGSGSVTPAPPRQRHDSHTSHITLQSLVSRDVSRVRNDSVCSSVSVATVPPTTAASPTKEKHISKSRRHEMNRRMTAMRRRRETVQRDKLTMYDLIFYNPTTNPIVPTQDELKVKEANEKEVDRKVKEAEEVDPDDPPEPAESAAPVPQIKLGPNGEIVLDEQSLVIKQTKDRVISSVVHEGAWSGGGRYSRAARAADWSESETVRFYRALAAIGTDFSLMAPLFPGRTRRELKTKFKKEERLNCAQVDKALRSVTRWDVVQLQQEFSDERAAAEEGARVRRHELARARRAERRRQRVAHDFQMRYSKSSKALETSVSSNHNDPRSVDDLLRDSLSEKRQSAATPTRQKSGIEPTCANDLIKMAMQANRQRTKSEQSNHSNIQTPKPNNVPLARAEQIGHPSTRTPKSNYATLTTVNNYPKHLGKSNVEIASISRTDTPQLSVKTPEIINSLPTTPTNIETGSLVVLTVNDPKSPTKKMLQTYIAHGGGRLTPVELPPSILSSVVGYMKKGTPRSNASTTPSPQLMSPNSVTSQDSRTSGNPSVIKVNPSPAKKQRHSSFTITQL
ncbi:transcription factor TFIIIB component B'' homolog isoform X2 [Achroia grisella]|uniref:transcription factor TFIIIB component B'' homolog isoform X2 n=1 Tax=Achroia grisella TaxID=688607 RepID=UPI0027D246B9|nr:transcription factor TFIIIB component B'' homolog isoform X2 [Achroia grisella]